MIHRRGMMTCMMRIHMALAAIVLAGGAQALADESSPPLDTPQSGAGDAAGQPPAALDEVLQRLQQLEEDNQNLRNEIDELRAQSGDAWMTEQRAEQIKVLVADVLADADTRASLLQGGLTAGWSDGFFLADPNGRFSMRIGGQVQVRWVFNFQDTVNDQYRHGFELPHTRLWVGGHLFRPELDIEYFVRGRFQREGGGAANSGSQEFGGTFNLQDAWLRIPFTTGWSIQAGQFKLPFNREELVESQYQLAVERSMVNESLNIGRSQGIELQYRGRSWRWNLMYSDGADDSLGTFGNLIGTSPPNTPALIEDVELAFTSRVEYLLAGNWKQFEDLTSPPGEEFGVLFGAAAHWQLDEQGLPPVGDTAWVGWTADASVEWGGANLFFQFIHHYADTRAFGVWNFYGIVVQGGIYLTPKWEAFGRYEWGGINSNLVTFPDLQAVTFGANYYLDGQDAKWTTDIGIGLGEISDAWNSDIAGTRADGFGTDEGQVILRTQFQILF